MESCIAGKAHSSAAAMALSMDQEWDCSHSRLCPRRLFFFSFEASALRLAPQVHVLPVVLSLVVSVAFHRVCLLSSFVCQSEPMLHLCWLLDCLASVSDQTVVGLCTADVLG